MRAYEILREFSQSPVNSWGRPIASDEKHLSAFWSWFGKSRVVDAKGNPIVVFHGTTEDFHSFDPNLSNSHSNTGVPRGAFFFSDSSGVAGSYSAVDLTGKSFRTKAEADEFHRLIKAGNFEDMMQYMHDHPQIDAPVYHDGANIKPCYLRMIKPLRVNARGDHWNDIYTALKKWHPKAEQYSTNEIAQYAIEHGYDGCIIRNVKDMGKRGETNSAATTYVVFSPQQIKSALFNKGSYSPDTSHIGENLNEGAIKVRDFKQWMENPEGFESDWETLEDDIEDAGGLTRYVIRGNNWKKTLANPLPIYRGLEVADPHAWAAAHAREVGYDLGTYWTDVFEVAFDQNGPDGGFQRGHDTNLIICATADEDAIDWFVTYAMRSVDSEEPEIRLHKGAGVHVSEILIVDTTNPEEPNEQGYRFGRHHIVKSIPVNKTLKI